MPNESFEATKIDTVIILTNEANTTTKNTNIFPPSSFLAFFVIWSVVLVKNTIQLKMI